MICVCDVESPKKSRLHGNYYYFTKPTSKGKKRNENIVLYCTF